jgi:hypothetical protein
MQGYSLFALLATLKFVYDSNMIELRINQVLIDYAAKGMKLAHHYMPQKKTNFFRQN